MSSLPNISLKKVGSNALVTRILQIAVGLFVTTTDFPTFESKDYLKVPTYDCSFDDVCRWAPGGNAEERWRLATTDPDAFLWFAATGTTLRPKSPYALIELHGKRSEWLMTNAIECQNGSAMLSFTYWTIGDADLEICLTDDMGHKYNCTGMLQARAMPGKVSLKIPELQRPYHISICPNSGPGVIALDNINYDAIPCVPEQLFLSTPSYLTPKTVSHLITTSWTKSVSLETKPESEEVTTEKPVTKFSTLSLITSVVEENSTRRNTEATRTTTEKPFDVLILGNKTTPFYDRRQGRFLSDTSQLLCDFSAEFPCRWGPESGRWGIIEQGAIPSLETINKLLPAYPAAVVIQGSAMLSSDPLRCQTGGGKILFRYWSNSKIFLQVCALGYGTKSMKIECVERNKNKQSFNDRTLAVFDLPNPIDEPFTLNIVPQWGRLNHNEYLVIDEIAYIGECDLDQLEERTRLIEETSLEPRWNQTTPISPVSTEFSTKLNTKIDIKQVEQTLFSLVSAVTQTATQVATATLLSTTLSTIFPETVTTNETKSVPVTASIMESSVTTPTMELTISESASTTNSTVTTTLKEGTRTTKNITPNVYTTSLPPITALPLPPNPFLPLPTTGPTYRPITRLITAMPFTEIINPITKKVTPLPESFTVGFTPYTLPVIGSYITVKDYCKLLNCNFEVNACNYLNHGLTKVPWSLRTRSYGYPLSRYSDIKISNLSGQFVSTLLSPGDFSILESPKFNMTRGLNVLLFQYYRPSYYSTIRLCIGSRYSSPFHTVQAFLQCPPILRSTSSRNVHRWNTAHAQLPSGTTHFYLVAHNVPTAREKTAIGIDNIRVAICEPKPDKTDYNGIFENPEE